MVSSPMYERLMKFVGYRRKRGALDGVSWV